MRADRDSARRPCGRAACGAVAAAPHFCIVKRVLAAGDPDVLLQAPDGRQLDGQGIADAAGVLTIACRRGAELEHIDDELANNVTRERRLELQQDADAILSLSAARSQRSRSGALSSSR